MYLEKPQEAQNTEPPLFFGNNPAEKMRLALRVLRNPDASDAHKSQSLNALRSEGIEYDPTMDTENPEILEGVVRRTAHAQRDTELIKMREKEEEDARREEDRLRAKIAEETKRAMASEQWKPKEKPSLGDRLRNLFG